MDSIQWPSLDSAESVELEAIVPWLLGINILKGLVFGSLSVPGDLWLEDGLDLSWLFSYMGRWCLALWLHEARISPTDLKLCQKCLLLLLCFQRRNFCFTGALLMENSALSPSIKSSKSLLKTPDFREECKHGFYVKNLSVNTLCVLCSSTASACAVPLHL